MRAKRAWLLAFLIFLPFGNSMFANEVELVVGKAREGVLRAGGSETFVLALQAGDFVQMGVEPRGKEIVVRSYDPAGARFRGGAFGPEENKFAFIAERAGIWRIEVSGKDKNVEGAFALALEKVVGVEARVAPAKRVDASPRIRALRSLVESGKRESVAAFWEEIRKEGAPLIEPLVGDEANMLVTFLWKGRAETRNVFVLRLPYAAGVPDDYLMKRLGETDVWYTTVKIGKKFRFDYMVAENVPRLQSVLQGIENDTVAMIAAAARPDPLNPKRWRVDRGSVDAPEYVGSSILEMPGAVAQPWITERPGVAAGRVEKHQLNSALLKNEREIAVYVPPGYSKSEKPYPVLVLFDEGAYLGNENQDAGVPTPTILNNLIAEKRIPPMVAVLVGNAPGARGRELPCNREFADFLSTELMPWAHGLYNFSADPRDAVVGGSSFGGLAAACAGLWHPETFGNVLSQSGSFWWNPPKSEKSLGEASEPGPNWVAGQFIAKPKLAVRFYLDAGSEEVDLSGEGNSILLTSRNLRDMLLAKGYEVHFQEFAGGHDYLGWRGTLADGLILLMGDAATK